MTPNEVKELIEQIKQALRDLKAKIDLVQPQDLAKQPASIQNNFFYCQTQHIILSGQLENAELKVIAALLEKNEAEIKKGIANLESILDKVSNGISFLGLIDKVVGLIAKMTTIFK